MKNFIVFLLLLFPALCFAQFDGSFHTRYAVINDPDGYTNVRAKASTDAPVVHVLYEGDIFEYGDQEGNWIRVHVPVNDFSLGNSRDMFRFVGYIHKSRVKALDDLEDCPENELSMVCDVEPFNPNAHVIEGKQGEWVKSVNGLKVWGTDGGLPRTQVNRIRLMINGKSIPVHKVFYQDLFECRNDFQVKKGKGHYFVYQANSDGAGSYSVIWVLSQSGIKQRIVRTEG